jgi:DNA polymerase-3 subunit beta
MKFEVSQQALLRPLQLISGVVERRHTLPVLSNLLLEVDNDGYLKLTATDQEVELSDRIKVTNFAAGETTVPARKLLDICKNLSSEEVITSVLDDSRLLLSSGRFISHLATLAATEFPKVEMETGAFDFKVQSSCLRRLLTRTSFAMAQQDVRFFFNGLLLEVEPGKLQTVATNGQRLALNRAAADVQIMQRLQVIIPRKGVVELLRLLDDESIVEVSVSANHLMASVGERSLTTKLIDATYPDYQRAIPAKGDCYFRAERRELKEALARTAILSNEMYRSIQLTLSDSGLNLRANNPQQEEAEETVAVEYEGKELQIAFNVGYLLDVLSVIDGERVEFNLADTKGAILVQQVGDEDSTFVVSPMVM